MGISHLNYHLCERTGAQTPLLVSTFGIRQEAPPTDTVGVASVVVASVAAADSVVAGGAVDAGSGSAFGFDGAVDVVVGGGSVAASDEYDLDFGVDYYDETSGGALDVAGGNDVDVAGCGASVADDDVDAAGGCLVAGGQQQDEGDGKGSRRDPI
ncbi:hypothetical protein PI126_g6856 [Phytophthora idaei]|nr:hypothetical protein PI126_g6856 [Phytophthora idaei]